MLKSIIFALAAMLSTPIVFAQTAWQSSSPTHVTLDKFETSGAVWDPYSNELVVVDDMGKIRSSSGSQIDIGDPDLEAIATSGNGFLYVGKEGGGLGALGVCVDKTPKIIELYAPPLATTGRSWKLPQLPAKCSEGMEGLTWVPNGAHPYGNRQSGGVFYASSQRDGKIYIFDVNLTFSDTTPTLLNPGGFTPLSDQTDISDLYYDPSQKILFVLYDAANRLVQVDISSPAPTIISNDRLPSTPISQEGVTFLPSCAASGTTTITLANDQSGTGYYSFSGFHGVCASDPRKAKTITQTVPLVVFPQETFPVSVTIQNTGTTTWTGSTFGLYPTEGPSGGVSLGASESVIPGQTKTFNLFITPPASGSFYLQWRMKQGGEWFGIPTPEVRSRVFVENCLNTGTGLPSC